MHNVAGKTITSHDGLKLYYETHGLETGRRVIFFVHGAGGDVDAWEFVRSQFLDKGFASISMDLRGHGYSAHPRSSKSYEIENLVADIVSVLDEEKVENIILIGHSYGAVVATHFAIEHPERLDKLIIISGTYSSPHYLRHRPVKKIVNRIINFAAFFSPKSRSNWHSKYPQGKVHKDYEFVGLIRTIFYNSWGSYLLTSKQNINLDIKHKLSKIKTPTLVIVGAKDSVFPHAISHQMHQEIANSKFEVIEEANHVVILNHPDETVNLIHKFLNSSR